MTKEQPSSKVNWTRQLRRAQDANNVLSDRLRTQRRVIEVQEKELGEGRDTIDKFQALVDGAHEKEGHKKTYEPMCNHCKNLLSDQKVSEARAAQVLEKAQEGEVDLPA